MSRPLLLDLFCGAGGAAEGYRRAGFEVIGVDNRPQPHYPFPFIQADALRHLDDLLTLDNVADFAAIHASPPCQRYSMMTRNFGYADEFPDLLPQTRELLQATGLPWVIENVPGAPMRADYKLCGCMFGLDHLRRERWFETSWHGFAMSLCHDHSTLGIPVVGRGVSGWHRKKLGRSPNADEFRALMGIDWMTREEVVQAIPPAYTEYIGKQLLAALEAAA